MSSLRDQNLQGPRYLKENLYCFYDILFRILGIPNYLIKIKRSLKT